MAEVYAALALNIAANDMSSFVTPVHAALGRNFSHVITPELALSLDRVSNSGQTALRDTLLWTPDTHPSGTHPPAHGESGRQHHPTGGEGPPSPHAGFNSRRSVMPLDAFHLPELALLKIGGFEV